MKNVTLNMVKDLIKELKGQVQDNEQEMRINAKVMDRESFAAAAHLDSVNTSLHYVIDELKKIVIHSRL